MRRIILLLVLASCGLALLCIEGLSIVWLGETNALVLPDAAAVRIDRPSLTRQRIVYHLPPNRAPSDVFRRLEQEGWMRDISAEQALRRDREEHLGDTFAVFWRRGWFGMASEVALVGFAKADGWQAEVRLSRCFAIAPWTRCL
jgi:hypothetical protein